MSADDDHHEPPRRVLLVSSEREIYGGERQLLLLADELRARGCEIELWARKTGRLLAEARARQLAVRPFSPVPSPANLLALRRRLRGFVPEIVHCNDPRALTSAGLAAVAMPGVLRTVARRVDFPIRSPLAYRLLAQRVLCVSERVLDRCRRTGMPAERLRLVPDAVESERVEGGERTTARRRLGVSADAPILLTLASFNPCKGHRELLAAVPAIRAAIPDCRLLLAGDGPLRDEIAALARSMADRPVELLGYREDVADLLAAADLLVLPSLSEGFGSVLAEASWVGLPAVATTVGGAPELLNGGHRPAGWLVPPGDPDALAAAVVEAVGSLHERNARSARARARAHERHAPARLVDRTLEAWSRRPAARR